MTKRFSLAAGVATLALAMSALAMSGCTTGGPGGDTEGTSGGGKTLDKVALMVSDLSNPFFSAMQDSVEEEAKAKGYSVTVQDGRQDLNTQNQQIDTFIQQGIDMLLLNAVDSQGIQPAVERAIEAGMVVVAVGDDAKGAQAVVAVDNRQAGEVSCQYMADQMGGKGDVAILDGTAVTAVQQRVAGCTAALEKIPGIKIVAQQNGDNSIGKAQLIATDVLTAQPTIGGIFGINDPTALGALIAAQDAGRDDIYIVGVDGSPSAVTELEKPDSMFVGTATQDPRAMVVQGLEVGKTLFDGEKLDEREVLQESKFVNRDNLSSYTPW